MLTRRVLPLASGTSARSLGDLHGLYDATDYEPAVPHIGAIRTVKPLRPHGPDVGRFIQGCGYDQAPVLPAGIAGERSRRCSFSAFSVPTSSVP